jgi:flagellar biosynthesis chaperone FliJ
MKEYQSRKKFTNNYEKADLKPKEGLDITGKNDMIFVRNRHQSILNHDFDDIVKRMWNLENERKSITQTKNESERLQKNIDKHMDERDRIYTNIQNLLKKEQEYEEKMLGKTLESMKSDGDLKITQKFKDVDIDSLSSTNIDQFKRLYPQFGTAIFEKIEIFNKKEKEIRETEEEFNQLVSNYNSALETIDVNIQKAKDNFSKYDEDLDIANNEIKDCRYYNSIPYKFASQKTKTLLNLNTSRHDLRKFSNNLNLISESISKLMKL